MAEILEIEAFLSKTFMGVPIIDVRSPSEYAHAHLPGAISIPLFDDQERKEVGILYKQKGKIKAVQRGLDFVGVKMHPITDAALKLAHHYKGENKGEILLYCWRGGMRSASVAWLLETVELKCYLLEGGYKSYRNHLLSSFEMQYRLIVIGGYTGSGKTEILRELRRSGEQVLDLEGLAHHKGSAFGSIGQSRQPSSEMFENLLFDALSKMDITRRIWVEDESRNVGRDLIPQTFWNTMLNSPLIKVETPYNIRLERVMRDYGCFTSEELAASIMKIEKRLGSEKCHKAYEACLAKDLESAAKICLDYYDKLYQVGLDMRFHDGREYLRLPVENIDVSTIVPELLKLTENL